MLTVLSSAGIPLSLLDDSVSLEEDEDFFDDEELLELSSLFSLISSSSLSLCVFGSDAVSMLPTEQSPSISVCIFALSAFSSVSSMFVFFFACRCFPWQRCIVSGFGVILPVHGALFCCVFSVRCCGGVVNGL